MKQSKTIIQVKNLTKKYSEFEAVKGISFEVKEGEIFGFLGPNGAGKTTTLEIIETLREETSGEVIVGGYSINKDPDKVKAIIGVQLQSAGFYDGLNLKEILELFGSLYNADVDTKKLLDQVQLGDRSKSKVNELSGGQRQRFSLATTIVHKPPIIFLDEPSTGLDPQARHNLWELIESIRADGSTIVMTTHFMDEAEYLCDRVAIIDEGKILKIDTPDNLVDELLSDGFKKKTTQREANLEDVFLNLTGKDLRE
jgi:ABC-2 type transport system ATP-binding protein